MLKDFKTNEVKVTEGLFRKRMDINIEYLKELDDTCLLQNYYFEAGIIIPGMMTLENPEKANLHWGWESPTCQLRGHFLGHYMSAAATIIANDGNAILDAKLRHIVSELRRCQELNGGKWAGPIPEKFFEVMTTDRYIWSPQYTIHKLLMGLLDTYKYTGNEEALLVLSGMADWFFDWTEDMKHRAPDTIFKGEQAGMLELWADAFAVTGDERYRTLAETYKGQGLFKLIKSGKDSLTDEHTNASIPIIQGAAKMYELTGDDEWRKIVEEFWKSAVTDRGMYATTGANAGEFWIPPMKMGEYRGDRGQEFCTVYNMVRVAQYLFKWTGDSRYSDYIEKCIYNGYLAQQNKDTGMPTYFLPMTTGSKKKWATKRNDFWCCQGTMIQAETRYPEMIYAADDEAGRLYVNQYIPSVLEGKVGDKKVKVVQTLNMKNYEVQTLFDEHGGCEKSRWKMLFEISFEDDTASKAFTISFRKPVWISDEPQVKVNDKDAASTDGAVSVSIEDGYINVTGINNNDSIEVFFPSEVRAERLPDMPYLAAFVDGPIVLAGLTGDIDVIEGNFDNPSEFMDSVTEHAYDIFIWLQNNYRTKRQNKNFKLIPLYDVKDEEYTLYFEEKK
ncbi:MAG: glycoside hydrolase family 127 protein [Eubacterium sp.]|nr:glycoside hydrolase family 127 protein [Eubacterium sp.]